MKSINKLMRVGLLDWGLEFSFQISYLWGILRDLAQFAQDKKSEKRPRRSVTFSDVAG